MTRLISDRLYLYLAGALVIGAALSLELPAYENNSAASQVMSTAPEFTHSTDDEWINSPPVSLDSLRGQVVLIDFSYWRAMNNRYWPAYYLLDKQGRIRGTYVGETRAGSRNARTIEKQIMLLLDGIS